VTNYDSSGEGTVSVIATATNNVTTITLGNYYEPIGIDITGDGTKAFVVEDGNWTVAEINTATNAVLAAERTLWHCSHHGQCNGEFRPDGELQLPNPTLLHCVWHIQRHCHSGRCRNVHHSGDTGGK
jgi:hypothetical protein